MIRSAHLLALGLAAFAVPGCGAELECPSCAAPARAGVVATLDLVEVSGVTASASLADVLYVHNDSSDSSRVFAMSRAGEDLGTYAVEDAANEDWEDIARGPCDAGSCLYIGDIGDNALARTSYSVYRVPEPAAVAPGEHSLASEHIVFAYEDGRHDAEVLLVHPSTGAVTIVTKAESGPASIYELPVPLAADRPHAATKVGELDPPEGSSKFTGGAIHPAGTGILLRTKTRLFHYPMAPDESAAEALTGAGCPLELADEAQGEAVTWLRDGAEILTLGEGQHAEVNVAECAPR